MTEFIESYHGSNIWKRGTGYYWTGGGGFKTVEECRTNIDEFEYYA